ncbi:MAG TPA: hypothetical protein VFO52_02650 [Longimicrobiales bacterium]|nr:hypothetical protein [Longimicrobiales bacterium]
MSCRKTKQVLWLVALAVLACDKPLAYEGGLPEPGILQVSNYQGPHTPIDPEINWLPLPDSGVLTPPRVLSAPDTVTAGVPFEVRTTTIGMSGCWRSAGQSSHTLDGVVEIRPRDVHSGADVCTTVLVFLDHASTVTIAQPGLWLLRVRGRRVIHNDRAWEEPVLAEKTVVVR